MIKEIGICEYKKKDLFPDITKKEIEKYEKFNILEEPNSWETYQYFQLDNEDSQKLIKKGRKQCMITTIKSRQQPHLDIVEYGENDEIVRLTNIDVKENGFNLINQTLSNCGETIKIYEQNRSMRVEKRFIPSAILLLVPIIEIEESPNRTVSYVFDYEDLENPAQISLHTVSSSIMYKRKDNGFYYLSEAGLLSKLRDFLSGSREMTLQEVEKKLKIKHEFTPILSNILKQSVKNMHRLEIPAELQKVLNAIHIQEHKLQENVDTSKSLTKDKDEIDNNEDREEK